MKKILQFFESSQPLLYLIIFSAAFLFFLWLLYPPYFADPDSFYHAKMAELVSQGGIVKDFPWLEFTTLKNLYIDHHLLYHVLLVPFVSIFNPLVGVKLAGIIFAALFLATFFWLLKKLTVKDAFWWTVFLLTINPFIFRLGLIKTPALVLSLNLFLIGALGKKNKLACGLLAFVYVWLHGSWPLALALSGCFWLASGFNQKTMDRQTRPQEIAGNWLHKLRTLTYRRRITRLRLTGLGLIDWKNITLPLSTLLGIILGLIINPYFPANLEFYWLQTVKIGLLNYKNIISVGGEWYGFGAANLVGTAPVFLSLWLLGLSAFWFNLKKQTRESWFLLTLSVVFLALTLKSRRNIEFFIPLGLLFTAVSFEIFRREKKLIKLLTTIRECWQKKFWLSSSLGLLLLLTLSIIMTRDIIWAKQGLHGSYRYSKYQAAAAWLAQNSKESEIVFHSDWDDSPVLFYHNDKNHYLVGLDPTFMYESDPNLYQIWVDITSGELRENLRDIIKDQFRARYILIEKNHQRMHQNIVRDSRFKLVYEDEEVWLYE